MLTSFETPGIRQARQRARTPIVFAVFSFRYDSHLVPDLIKNIGPIVDGWVAFDDRAAETCFSNEPARHRQLVHRARELGADWVLAVDPDERFEEQARFAIRSMTAHKRRVIWAFRFRELYAPREYRVDGIWGRKVVERLFPLFEGQVFSERELHGPKYPIEPGYDIVESKVNLYHLKMITPERRMARRDLYRYLDPEKRYQAIGYDYLADEGGSVFETIPPDRMYLPAHHDDGGLWMGAPPAARRSP